MAEAGMPLGNCCRVRNAARITKPQRRQLLHVGQFDRMSYWLSTGEWRQCRPSCPPKRDAGRQDTPATRVRRVDDRSPRTAINPPTTCVLPSGYLKLCTRLVMVRLHPSTSTNSSNLKGREIIAGGNMNMPILMSTLATTASMMMNGR